MVKHSIANLLEPQFMSDEDNLPLQAEYDAGLQQALRNSSQGQTLRTGMLYRRLRTKNNQPRVHHLPVRPVGHPDHHQTVAMYVLGALPNGNCPVNAFLAGALKPLIDNSKYAQDFIESKKFDKLKPYLIAHIDTVKTTLAGLHDYRDDLSPHIKQFIAFLTHYKHNLTAEIFLDYLQQEVGRARLAALQIALQPAFRAYAEDLDTQQSEQQAQIGLLSEADKNKNLAEHGNAIHTGPTLVTKLAHEFDLHVCYLSTEDNPAKGLTVGVVDDSYYDHSLPADARPGVNGEFENHYQARLAKNEPTIYLLYANEHFDLAVPTAEFADHGVYQCADDDFDDVLDTLNAAYHELATKINQQVSGVLDTVYGNNPVLVQHLLAAASGLYEHAYQQLEKLETKIFTQLDAGTITIDAAIKKITTEFNATSELNYQPQQIIDSFHGNVANMAKQKSSFFYRPINAGLSAVPANLAASPAVACAS